MDNMPLLIVFTLVSYLSLCNTLEFASSPQNTAVKIGESTSLSCEITDLGRDHVEWIHYPKPRVSSSGYRIFVSNKPGEVTNSTHFAIQSGRVGQYNLMIKGVTSLLSGEYVCRALLADQLRRARLIAMGPMSCSPAPGRVSVSEGSVTSLDCSVHYHGYQGPVLEWSTAVGRMDNRDLSAGHVRRYLTAVSARPYHNGLEFVCKLGFAEGKSSDIGSLPTYTDQCTTYINVDYAPRDIVFTPDVTSAPGGVIFLAVGDELRCNADARPSPAYQWEKVDFSEGPDIQFGSVLVTDSSWVGRHKYTCTASNYVGNQHKMAQRTVTFVVGSTFTMISDTSGVSHLTPTAGLYCLAALLLWSLLHTNVVR